MTIRGFTSTHICPPDLGTLGIMVLSMDWLAKMCLVPLLLNRLDIVMIKKPECCFLAWRTDAILPCYRTQL
jgi:hypothetical protein